MQKATTGRVRRKRMRETDRQTDRKRGKCGNSPTIIQEYE